jgi:hypothetical protein
MLITAFDFELVTTTMGYVWPGLRIKGSSGQQAYV